jgi:hypothetical protein
VIKVLPDDLICVSFGRVIIRAAHGGGDSWRLVTPNDRHLRRSVDPFDPRQYVPGAMAMIPAPVAHFVPLLSRPILCRPGHAK